MLNPLLEAFPSAVTFKVEWALDRISAKELTIECLFSRIGDLQLAFEKAEHDVFLYPGKESWKEAEETFQILSEIVAILSFAPGGVEMFGVRYEVQGLCVSCEAIHA